LVNARFIFLGGEFWRVVCAGKCHTGKGADDSLGTPLEARGGVAVQGLEVAGCGAGSGNLWKTKNNGTTWEPIFENESTFAIGCVTIAPSDPNIVWVGTGEVLMARSSYAGTGVFKSTDAGKTWQNMGLHDSHHVPQIVIDPEDPDVVYALLDNHEPPPEGTRRRWRGEVYRSGESGPADSWE